MITKEKQESIMYQQYQEGLQQFQQQKYLESIQCFENILKNEIFSQPNQEFEKLQQNIIQTLAQSFLEIKDNRKALIYLYKLTKFNIPNFSNWVTIAKLCNELGYTQESEKCFNKALQYMPSVHYKQIIYEFMTQTSFFNDDYQKMIERCDSLIGSHYKENEINALKHMGTCLMGFNIYFQISLFIFIRNSQYDCKSESNLYLQKIIQEKIKIQENKKRVEQNLWQIPKENVIEIQIAKNSWPHFLKKLKFVIEYIQNIVSQKKSKSQSNQSQNFKFEINQQPGFCNTFITMNFCQKNPSKKSVHSRKMQKLSPEKQSKRILKNTTDSQSQLQVNNLNQLILKIDQQKNLSLPFQLLDLKTQFFLNIEKKFNCIGLFEHYFKDLLHKNNTYLIEEDRIAQNEIIIPEENINEYSLINNYSEQDFATFKEVYLENNRRFRVIEMIEIVIRHFTENKFKNIEQYPSDLIRIPIFNYKYETLQFSPHFLLIDENIKKITINFILAIQQFSQGVIKEDEYILRLTILELLLNQQCNPSNQNQNDNQNDLIERQIYNLIIYFYSKEMQSSIEQDSSFLMIGDCQIKNKIKTQIIMRLYRATIFYFKNPMFKQNLQNYESIEKISEKLKKILQDYNEINIFWIDCQNLNGINALSNEFFSQIDEQNYDKMIGNDNNLDNINTLLNSLLQKIEDKVNNFLVQKSELDFEKYKQFFNNNLAHDYQKIIQYFKFIKKGGTLLFFENCKDIIKIILSLIEKKLLTSNFEIEYQQFIQWILNDSFKFQFYVRHLNFHLKKFDLDKDIGNIEIFYIYIYEIFVVIYKICLALLLSNQKYNVFDIMKSLLNCGRIIIFSFSKDIIYQKLQIQLFRSIHLLMDLAGEDYIVQLHNDLISLRFRIEIVNTMFDVLEQEKQTEKNDSEITLYDVLYDEIQKYFQCNYNIVPVKGNIERIQESQKLQNRKLQLNTIQEINLCLRYIKIFEFNDILIKSNIRFNGPTQYFLSQSFDILKQNDSSWNQCKQLQSILQSDLQFVLNNIGTKEEIQFHLANIVKRKREVAQKICFCENLNCYSEENLTYLYNFGFFLVALALEDTKFNEQKKIKEQIKKSYQMHQINVCFHPYRFHAWFHLARVAFKLSFFYFDSLVLNSVPTYYKSLKNFSHHSQIIIQLLENQVYQQQNSFIQFSDKISQEKGQIIYQQRYELVEMKFINLLNQLQQIHLNFINILASKAVEQQNSQYCAIIQKISDIKFDFAKEFNNEIYSSSQFSVKIRSAILYLFFLSQYQYCNFCSIKQIKIINDLQSLKGLLQQQKNLNLNFKGEFYDIECEFVIIFKIWKAIHLYYDILQVALTKKEERNVQLILSDFNIFYYEMLKLLQVEAEQCNENLTYMDLCNIINIYKNYSFSSKRKIKIEFASKSIIENQLSKNDETYFVCVSLEKFTYLTKLIISKLSLLLTKHKKMKGKNNYQIGLYYKAKIITRMQPSYNLQNICKLSDELVKISSTEIVEYYKFEKDSVISQYLHRNLYFMIMRYKFFNFRLLANYEAEDLGIIKQMSKKVLKYLYFYDDEKEEYINMVYSQLLFQSLMIFFKLFQEILEKIQLIQQNLEKTDKEQQQLAKYQSIIEQKWFFSIISDFYNKQKLVKQLEKYDTEKILFEKYKKLIISGYNFYQQKSLSLENEESFEQSKKYFTDNYKKKK